MRYQTAPKRFLLNQFPEQSIGLELCGPAFAWPEGASSDATMRKNTHTLIFCQSGAVAATTEDDKSPLMIHQGEVALINRAAALNSIFKVEGREGQGFLQHFRLDLADRGDMIRHLSLKPKVKVGEQGRVADLANALCERSEAGEVKYQQRKLFLRLLHVVLREAFLGWNSGYASKEGQDHLARHVLKTANRIASPQCTVDMETVIADVPYNESYFRRAFRNCFGYTPQQFRELKRMERAANRLGSGVPIKTVAAEMGYGDPFFFSRMFKRYLGRSPSQYRQ